MNIARDGESLVKPGIIQYIGLIAGVLMIVGAFFVSVKFGLFVLGLWFVVGLILTVFLQFDGHGGS